MLGGLPNINIKPLIILGAGASHDFISDLSYRDPGDEHRKPPLANNLFQDNPFFRGLKGVDQFKNIQSLMGNVVKRMKLGRSLEEVLDDIQNNPNEEKQFKEELPILKNYLAFLFSKISYHNISFAGNNYQIFFRSIMLSCEDCLVVNFNYDYLAQKAISDTYNFEFDHFIRYLNKRIKLIHIHGSVLWGISNEGDYKLKTGYGDKVFSNSAITIPTIKGKNFACPIEQQEYLDTNISSVNVIVIIGWKGKEDHFKALLNTIKEVHRIIIIGGSDKSNNECLKNSGLSRFRCEKIYVKGFLNFLDEYTDFSTDVKEEHIF